MRTNTGRQKSFLQSFNWVGIILLAMGAVFLCVAVIMQLIPMSPESVNMSVNGVRQPSTEESVQTFRLTFLLTFGIIGLGLAVAGGIVIARAVVRRKRALSLKENGVRIIAEVTGFSSSAMQVNNVNLMFLQCSYIDFRGTTYIFKSGLLRMNPIPYLPQGKVNVYHDRNNMSRYFVDVDGSAGLGTKVVEL